MTHLERLLAGYQHGLADTSPSAIQALRANLAETNDSWQRGVLLGRLATALARSSGPCDQDQAA
jgi:hypothetical protein